MSLFSWFKSLNPKTIIIFVLVIGLIVSIVFNILNADKQPTPTVQESNTQIKGVDWSYIGKIAAIPVGVVSILGFLVYNYKALFDEVLNGKLMTDVCSIMPGTVGEVSRIPSLYLAHISFFFAYLFMNAYSIYNYISDPSVEPNLIMNRQYRSVAVMALIVLVFLVIVGLRFALTHCESPLGFIVNTATFTLLGFLWYKFAEYCGARNSDIMGISQSMVPANVNTPVVCGRVNSSS